MQLQTRKPQKLKEKLIGNHKETQNTLKISGLFHFTRLVKTFSIKNPIVVSYGKCHLGHFQTISFQPLTFGANWLYFQAPPTCPKVKCHRKTCCFIWVNCELGDFDFAWKTFVSFPYILNEHIKRIFDHSSSLLLTVKKIAIALCSYVLIYEDNVVHWSYQQWHCRNLVAFVKPAFWIFIIQKCWKQISTLWLASSGRSDSHSSYFWIAELLFS